MIRAVVLARCTFPPVVVVPYDQAYEEGFEDMPRRVQSLEKIRQLIGASPVGAGKRPSINNIYNSTLAGVG